MITVRVLAGRAFGSASASGCYGVGRERPPTAHVALLGKCFESRLRKFQPRNAQLPDQDTPTGFHYVVQAPNL